MIAKHLGGGIGEMINRKIFIIQLSFRRQTALKSILQFFKQAQLGLICGAEYRDS